MLGNNNLFIVVSYISKIYPTKLVQEQETVWANSSGYADIETGREMTTDTYCLVKSISKSITAWCVMYLVQHSYIDLDMSVKHCIKTGDPCRPNFS